MFGKEKKTIVQSFKNAKEAERFINKKAKEGYEVVDMTDGKKHYSLAKGIGGGILLAPILGPFGLLLGRGKSRLTVTLTKADSGNAKEDSGGLTELEKLAGLKEKGILTPEEFEAKKKQILGI